MTFLVAMLLVAAASCFDSSEQSSHNSDSNHGGLDASAEHPARSGDANSVDLATDLATVCPGSNPAQECRMNLEQCLPSSCFCQNGVWGCTADCAGGVTCSKADAGADASEHAGH